jgi:hypothetical protein
MKIYLTAWGLPHSANFVEGYPANWRTEGLWYNVALPFAISDVGSWAG